MKVTLNIPEAIFSDIIVRESALIQFSRDVAESRVESVYPPTRILGKPLNANKVTNSCSGTNSWTFCGHHVTDTNGQTAINLNKFLYCASDIEGTAYSNYISELSSFVATANSSTPVFLTYEVELENIPDPNPDSGGFFTPSAYEIRVKVYSWSHNGEAAPNIAFGWTAITKYSQLSNL